MKKKLFPLFTLFMFMLQAFSPLIFLNQPVRAASVQLAPIAVGNNDQWTVSSGTKVAAVASSGGVYIQSSTDGHAQTFKFANAGIPSNAVVSSVKFDLTVSKNQGGGTNPIINLKTENNILSSNGSDESVTTVGGNFSNKFVEMALNPLTGLPWTTSEVNNWTTNFGVYLNAKNEKEIRVDHMYLTVNYTVPVTGTLEVTKSVNWNGATPNDQKIFEVCITGPSYPDSNCKTIGHTGGTIIWPGINTGEYTVTETDPGNDWLVTGSGATVNVSSTGTATTTITNSLKLSSITITKNVVPDDLSEWDFMISGNGQNHPINDLANGESGTVDNLIPGVEYTVTETTSSDYDIAIHCDRVEKQNGFAVTLTPGQVLNCVFTNTKKGSFTIKKVTNPEGSVEEFTFTGGAEGSIKHGEQIDVDNVSVGNYIVTESLKDNWKLTSIECDDGLSPNPSTIDVENRTATIKIDSAEYVICTFTNTLDLGNLEVEKTVEWSGATINQSEEFEICITGPSYLDGDCKTLDYQGGKLLWTGLIPGSYNVKETVNGVAWTVTGDDQNVDVQDADRTANVSITNTLNLGSVSGYKWNDINGNGERDCDEGCEPLLPSWNIFLDENDNGIYDGDEILTQTDSNGLYKFDELVPGQYRVCEVEQTNWHRTYPVASNCHSVTVYPGQENHDNNFGNYEGGQISGWKYRDVNGNGSFDTDERLEKDDNGFVNKLNGWTINLYDLEWKLLKSMETGDDETEAGNVFKGQFKFVGLELGEYYVCEVLHDGWIQTEPVDEQNDNCYKVLIGESGDSVRGLKFGNFELGMIQGYKWDDLNGDGVWDEDEPAIEGWVINLWELSKVEEIEAIQTSEASFVSVETNEEGLYLFNNLRVGKYLVCEELQDGWMQTFPGSENTELSTAAIAVEGCWEFEIISGSSENGDFGNFKLGLVEGFVWNDIDGDSNKSESEPKLPGWEIQLWDEKFTEQESEGLEVAILDGEPGEKIGDPVITDENGNFMFKDLKPGVYYISEVLKSGWTQKYPTEPLYHKVIIDESGKVVEDVAFGNQEIPVPTPTPTLTPEPGQVLGIDDQIGSVLGAADVLSQTGRNLIISLFIGWSLIMTLAILDLRLKKQD